MSQLQQVKASAGSGKTFDLTCRFLMRLMEADLTRPASPACALHLSARHEPAGWGDILAVTFTNAAASEMRQRVISYLKSAALGKNPLNIALSQEKAAQWVDTVLRDMSALNIRTIDSLIHLIVRAAALELGLHPDYTPVFNIRDIVLPYYQQFMEDALHNTQARALLQEACTTFIYEGDGKGFVAGNRFVSKLETLLESLILEKFHHLAPTGALKEKLEAFSTDFSAAAEAVLHAADACSAQWQRAARKAVEAMADGTFKQTSVFADREALEEFFSAKGPVSDELEHAFAQLVAAKRKQKAYGGLLTKALRDAPFIRLTALIIELFKAEQHKIGVLPAQLAPLLAARILQSPHGVPETLCRMGTRLTHYLIDEFQDTSREQWAALLPLLEEALSRGGSLTWVGDVKQSIYSWRGGDPALFDEVLHEPALLALVEDDGHARTRNLPYNWRSCENIILHTNALFKPLTEAGFCSDMLRDFLPQGTPQASLDHAVSRINAAFAGLEQDTAKAPHGGLVRVEVLRPSAASADSESAENADTAPVWERLRQLLSEDIGRRRPWSDVLVLVRENKQARQAATVLVDAGIPVVTENSLLLAEHPLILQTVALLAFLEDPQNNIAFWTLVTGQIILEHPAASGLTLANLHDKLVQARPQGALFEVFRQEYTAVWQELLEPFYNQSGLMTPYDIVLEWYTLLHVEERYPQYDIFLRRFMEVLHSAEVKGMGTLSSFLEYWHDNHGDEKIPMPENMNAVRIMTVHKSKGLEAPVVVVPSCNFDIRTQLSSHMVKVDIDGLNAVVPLLKDCGALYYDKIVQQGCENFNLLYVTLTRAREELHIFHDLSGKRSAFAQALEKLWLASGLVSAQDLAATRAEPEAPAAAGHSLLYSMGQPEFRQDKLPQAGITTAEPQPAMTQAHAAPMPAEAEDLTALAAWRPMQWLPRLKIFRNSLSGFAFEANDRGSLLHFCLEHLHITGDPGRDAAEALRFGIDHFFLPVPEDAALHASLLKALQWFAAEPHSARWLSQGSPEQSLLDAAGHVKRMDLLVQERWGTLVIDYKSGQHHPEHLEQVRDYLHCLRLSGASRGTAKALLIYLDLQQYLLVDAETVSAMTADISLLLPES